MQSQRGNERVRRIVVFSYGWSYDAEGSYRTYRQTLDAIAKNLDASEQTTPGSTVVIGVGSDASLTGFRKLFDDVIPFPMIADTLALVPNEVLFPVSFWSEAAMADRIGYGGLRTSLTPISAEAYPSPDEIPDLFLLGHSFGTRVIAGLLEERFELLPVRSEPFEARDRVAGVERGLESATSAAARQIPGQAQAQPEVPFEREVSWGRRGNGLFSLGTLHESVGRTSAPGFLSRSAPAVFGMESVRFEDGEECQLPSCRKTFALDASSAIREGGLGLDLERPLANFTLGSIDPIGAHGDYLGPGPVRVISATLARPGP